MSVLDDLVANYKASREKFVDVKGWGSGGATLRVRWLVPTLDELAKLDRLISLPDKNDADIVIAMALDENGKPLFQPDDKLKLCGLVDGWLLRMLARRMLGLTRTVTDELVEVAEKN